jgi:hypothetical protein
MRFAALSNKVAKLARILSPVDPIRTLTDAELQLLLDSLRALARGETLAPEIDEECGRLMYNTGFVA